jgi:hypothetical protein
VFQFGVFFRYVDLSDQGQKINSDLDRVKAAQATLADVQAGIAGIGKTIETAKLKVAESLSQGQAALRKKLIAGVAKPLSAVSLDVRDVVRYDPAILSAAVVFFLARYWLLRRRASALAAECRDVGYGDRIVRLYFADPTDTLTLLSPIRDFPAIGTGLKALSLAAPGVLAIMSAWRIFASKSLYPVMPGRVYAAALAALLVSYFLVFLPVLTSSLRRSAPLAH